MFSGVSKSGSPGPKSITSTPFSLRAFASIMTAMVGDTLTAVRRWASRTSLDVICRLLARRRARRPGPPASAPHGRREASLETRRDVGGHQTRDISTQPGHFLHQTTAHVRVGL